MTRFGARILALAALLSACGPAGQTQAPSAPLDDAAARDLLAKVYHPDRGIDDGVVRAMAASGRREFVPVLVELLRFRGSDVAGVPYALQRLTGRQLDDDWSRWVEWLGDQDVPTPLGFDAWKADLFAQIDRRFRDFLYAGVPTRIKLEEIVWGGVRKDGIPALVDPPFVPAGEASHL